MLCGGVCWPQGQPGTASPETMLERLQKVESTLDNQRHIYDQILKQIDDLTWYQRIGDLAEIEKVHYAGPAGYIKNPNAQDAGNALVVAAYALIPKSLDRTKKYPLIVFTHGGMHLNFLTDLYGTMVRELIQQGYVVVAPEYRGSSGYGADFFNQLDYGGKEIEDVYLGGQWALERYPFLDRNRVGIIGWSHGGFLTLWNVFNHPDFYKVGFAINPVSNMALRAGTKAQDAKGFAGVAGYGSPSSIGASAFDNVKEYVRRSPVYNADKLQTPLLIYTATNDSDVNVFEVQQLIDALKVRGKQFDYKIYQEPPGEHYFLFLDTTVARQARLEAYRFLARHLSPPQPLTQ
jgi:dipeptidyl aminopeptidase/acylaminoacyl peptidase